ncbi:hypothetical protein QTN25_005355 [Entamoeba marina]
MSGNNTQQLDSYSALISAKYFETSQDYINLIYQDTKIEGIDDYEIWYKVNYDQYLKYKQDNIKFKYIVYTNENRIRYGNVIPEQVNILGLKCFSDKTIYTNDASKIKEIDIPTKVIALGFRCFSLCRSLQSITLPPTLTSLGDHCFCNCKSLTSIILPPTIKSLSEGCFSGCSSLTSINLPSSLTQFGKGCFFGCDQLKNIITVPDICYQPHFFCV